MSRSIQVPSLPREPGPAGWNALLPEPAPARMLEEQTTADWLVIGAGFAGLAAAKRLSQLRPEDRIVVLEAKRVAEGPAGRNSGFMIDLPHDLQSDDYAGALEADRRQTRANRYAIDFAQAMAEEAGLSDEAFDRCGKINGAATDKGHQHNVDYAEHLGHLDEPHEMLDAQGMKALTGIDYYQSGLYTPGSAMLQPALFVRGLATALGSNRVQVYEASPVTGLSRTGLYPSGQSGAAQSSAAQSGTVTVGGGSGDWVATTPQGQITAPKVILAVNGLINDFGFYQGQLMHVFTYASMTRALSAAEVEQLGGAPRWHLTPADPMGTTVRRLNGTGGNRLVVRNRFTFDESKEVPQRRFANIARDHDRCFAARFPMLAGMEMDYRWGGRLCMSINNVAAFGEVENGLFSACCQNGLGLAKGTLHGICAAELATGHRSEALDYCLSEDQPDRVPGGPFKNLGANSVIKWNEFRAGREF